MMDLLIQIATSQKLSASNYILQAIDERGFVLPHHSNTPIGSLDVLQVTKDENEKSMLVYVHQCILLQVKLVPKQETIGTKKIKSTSSRPFETTFRLQVNERLDLCIRVFMIINFRSICRGINCMYLGSVRKRSSPTFWMKFVARRI